VSRQALAPVHLVDARARTVRIGVSTSPRVIPRFRKLRTTSVGPAYAKRKGADVRAVAQCFPGPSPPLFGVWVAAPCVLSAPSTCHEHDTLRWGGKQSGNDHNRRDSPSLRPLEPRAALIYAACRSRGSGPSPTIRIAASARAEGYSAVPRVHGHRSTAGLRPVVTLIWWYGAGFNG